MSSLDDFPQFGFGKGRPADAQLASHAAFGGANLPQFPSVGINGPHGRHFARLAGE
jgi:hypothetical protein